MNTGKMEFKGNELLSNYTDPVHLMKTAKAVFIEPSEKSIQGQARKAAAITDIIAGRLAAKRTAETEGLDYDSPVFEKFAKDTRGWIDLMSHADAYLAQLKEKYAAKTIENGEEE